MKWFRLYSSVVHDPKVQRLHPAYFKHWINILCLCSENPDRGLVPSYEDVAFALRVKPSEAEIIVEKLHAAGLLDVDAMSTGRRFFPHNWTSRQRASDDASTRQRHHRNKLSQDSGKLQDDVTLPLRTVERERDTDTDTDTDKNKEVRSDPVKKPARPSAPKMTDEEWMISLKTNPAYQHVNIDIEFGKLQAWCINNKKLPTRGRFLNWINRIEAPMKPGLVPVARKQGPVTFNQQSVNNTKDAMRGFVEEAPDAGHTREQEAVRNFDGQDGPGIQDGLFKGTNVRVLGVPERPVVLPGGPGHRGDHQDGGPVPPGV